MKTESLQPLDQKVLQLHSLRFPRAEYLTDKRLGLVLPNVNVTIWADAE